MPDHSKPCGIRSDADRIDAQSRRCPGHLSPSICRLADIFPIAIDQDVMNHPRAVEPVRVAELADRDGVSSAQNVGRIAEAEDGSAQRCFSSSAISAALTSPVPSTCWPFRSSSSVAAGAGAWNLFSPGRACPSASLLEAALPHFLLRSPDYATMSIG